MKRLCDILFSAFGLLIISPFFLLILVLIKITSHGKAFYRQIRMGLNRKEFWLIKFRTMYENSDKAGLLITSKDDSRITTIGKILRRTKLDELPELWNVLKGDMSLVGPRPEVPRYVAFYKAEWEAVFSVRPGITDLATLQFRDEESLLKLAENKETAYVKIVLPIKMKLALEYVEKQSIVLDLKILFLTVWSITLGRFLAQPENELAELAKKRILEFTKRYKKTANGNTIF